MKLRAALAALVRWLLRREPPAKLPETTWEDAEDYVGPGW